MLNELLQTGVMTGLLNAGVRLSAPFLLASTGEMYSQRSGVLNLGVEGIMMVGAFVSFFIAFKTGSPVLALTGAVITGLLFGLVMAFASITMKGDQEINGIGIYILGMGLSGLFFRLTMGSIAQTKGFSPFPLPLLSKIPFIGEILFNQNCLVYFALLLVPISWFILFKTTWGLKIRATGENPHAADSLGVSVEKTRYICVITGSILAALAGAFLTIGQEEAAFVDNIAGGRGFIAVALVYFGRWNPFGIMGGAFLFSMIDALQLRLQVLNIGIPYEYAVMAPYIITILALIFVTGKARGPSALGKVFEREGS